MGRRCSLGRSGIASTDGSENSALAGIRPACKADTCHRITEKLWCGYKRCEPRRSRWESQTVRDRALRPACQIVATGAATSRSPRPARGARAERRQRGNQETRRTRRMLERLPGSTRIRKYTGRDIPEGFVGGVSLPPVLVEDGVFSIAEWSVLVSAGPAPTVLVANVAVTAGPVSGLPYYTDIRSPGAAAVRARPPPARRRVADLADRRRRNGDPVGSDRRRGPARGAVGRITGI